MATGDHQGSHNPKGKGSPHLRHLQGKLFPQQLHPEQILSLGVTSLVVLSMRGTTRVHVFVEVQHVFTVVERVISSVSVLS